MASWKVNEPGWWDDLFAEATRELAEKYKSDPTVLDVFRANYHGSLEIIIRTSAKTAPFPWLDGNYRGIYRGLPARQVFLG